MTSVFKDCKDYRHEKNKDFIDDLPCNIGSSLPLMCAYVPNVSYDVPPAQETTSSQDTSVSCELS